MVTTVLTEDVFARVSGLHQRVTLAAAITTLRAWALTWWHLGNQQSAGLAFCDPLTKLANVACWKTAS